MAHAICFALILSVCQLFFGCFQDDHEQPESIRDFLLLEPSIIDLPRSELEKLDATFRENISNSRQKLHERITDDLDKIFQTLNKRQRSDLAKFLGVEIEDLGKGYQRIRPQLYTRTKGEYQIIELLGGRKFVTSSLCQGISEQRKEMAKAEFEKLLKCSTPIEFEAQWKAIENKDMLLNSMAYIAYLTEDQFLKLTTRFDQKPFTREYNGVLCRWRRNLVTIQEQNTIVERELKDLKIDWGEANGLSGWYDFQAIWHSSVFNDVTPVYRQLIEEQYDWLSPAQRKILAESFRELGHSSAGYQEFVSGNNDLISFAEENIFPVQCSIIPQHFFLSEGPVFFLSRREMVKRFSISETQLDAIQDLGARVSKELTQLEKELCEECIKSVIDALPGDQRQRFCQRIQDDYGQTPAEHFSSVAKNKLMGLLRTKWRSPEQLERIRKFTEGLGSPTESNPIRYPMR